MNELVLIERMTDFRKTVSLASLVELIDKLEETGANVNCAAYSKPNYELVKTCP